MSGTRPFGLALTVLGILLLGSGLLGQDRLQNWEQRIRGPGTLIDPPRLKQLARWIQTNAGPLAKIGLSVLLALNLLFGLILLFNNPSLTVLFAKAIVIPLLLVCGAVLLGLLLFDLRLLLLLLLIGLAAPYAWLERFVVRAKLANALALAGVILAVTGSLLLF